jgi:hypothetical protein
MPIPGALGVFWRHDEPIPNRVAPAAHVFGALVINDVDRISLELAEIDPRHLHYHFTKRRFWNITF